MGDVLNEADDKKFVKVIVKKQVLWRDAILAHFTPQIQERSMIADIEEKGDNHSLFKSSIDNNYPLSN